MTEDCRFSVKISRSCSYKLGYEAEMGVSLHDLNHQKQSSIADVVIHGKAYQIVASEPSAVTKYFPGLSQHMVFTCNLSQTMTLHT